MDEQTEAGLIDAGLGPPPLIGNVDHPLDLDEVVASADGAKGVPESGRFNSPSCEPFRGITFPSSIQIEAADHPLGVEAARIELDLPQANATPDIGADQMGIQELADERSSDRVAWTRMEIRQPHGRPHAGQPGGRLQLSNGFTLDPALRAGDDPNGGPINAHPGSLDPASRQKPPLPPTGDHAGRHQFGHHQLTVCWMLGPLACGRF
jgi:hypothetical protein